MSASANWPGAGGFSDVIALAKPTAGDPHGTLTWIRGGESALVDARAYPFDAQAISGLAAVDVGGEAGDELLAFGDGLGTFHTTVDVFALPAQREQPLEDTVRGAALDGAHNADEARARLPLDRARTAAEKIAASDTAWLAQLVFTSAADLAASIGPRGLRQCRVTAPSGGRRREQCTTLAGRNLTAQALERGLRDRLRSMFDAAITQTYTCAATPSPHCHADQVQGFEIDVAFTGAGAERKVTTITTVDHQYGE